MRESERLISRPLLGAGVPESKDKSLTGGGSIGSLEELPFVGQDFFPPLMSDTRKGFGTLRDCCEPFNRLGVWSDFLFEGAKCEASPRDAPAAGLEKTPCSLGKIFAGFLSCPTRWPGGFVEPSSKWEESFRWVGGALKFSVLESTEEAPPWGAPAGENRMNKFSKSERNKGS